MGTIPLRYLVNKFYVIGQKGKEIDITDGLVDINEAIMAYRKSRNEYDRCIIVDSYGFEIETKIKRKRIRK